MRILSLVSTTKLALAGVAVAVGTTNYARVLRVYSNRNIHVTTVGAATLNDLPVTDLNAVLIAVAANDILSVIQGEGEADGDLWVSEVKVI